MEQLSQRRHNYLPLFVVPILVVGIAIGLGAQKGPYWLGFRLDPEYVYLVNSLSLALGKAPGHIDHPGTPVQILGGMVLRLVHSLESLTSPAKPSLEIAVLQQPEHYLTWLNGSCIGLIGFTLLLVGYVAYQLDYGLPVALVLQGTPCLTVSGLTTMNRFTPEPVIFAIVQLLVVLLLFLLHQKEPIHHPRFSLALGGLLGLGLACKITFLPMLVLLLVLPGIRQRVLGLLTTIVAFLIATLPIWPQYPKVFAWFLDITTHTGNYGGGEQGLVNWSALVPSLRQMLVADPVFFLMLGVAVVGYSISSMPQLSKDVRAAGANQAGRNFLESGSSDQSTLQPKQLLGLLLLTIAGQLVMTLKHPIPLTVSDIELRYLMPGIGLMGLLSIVTISLVAKQLASQFRLPSVNLIGLGLLVLCLTLNTHKIWTTLQGMKAYQQEVVEVLDRLDNQYAECVRINYYRSSSVEYALYFGNGYAHEDFSKTLAKLYTHNPPRLFYHFWRQTFETFTQKVAIQPAVIAQLLGQPCVLLQGSPISDEEVQHQFPGAQLEKLTETQLEGIYRLRPVDESSH